MPATIRRILCPVDFSETSARALAYADGLAASTSSELMLIHAFEIPASLTLAGMENPHDPKLRTKLDALPLPGSHARADRILHAGPPGEVICWTAESRGCDLIVMGTHGRSGLTHLFLGSVAEYVMRNARCPVLTVRDRPQNEPPLPEPLVLPPKAPRFM